MIQGANYKYQGFKVARAVAKISEEVPVEAITLKAIPKGGVDQIVAIDDLASNVAALTGKSAFHIGFDLSSLDKQQIFIPQH